MFETENDKEVLKDTIRDTDEMSFDVGDADYISKVFDKFLEWENVAKTNNAVDFEKEINRRTPNKSWVIIIERCLAMHIPVKWLFTILNGGQARHT